MGAQGQGPGPGGCAEARAMVLQNSSSFGLRSGLQVGKEGPP